MMSTGKAWRSDERGAGLAISGGSGQGKSHTEPSSLLWGRPGRLKAQKEGSCDQTQQASPCQLPPDATLRFRTKKSRKRTHLSAVSRASPGSNRVFLSFSL